MKKNRIAVLVTLIIEFLIISRLLNPEDKFEHGEYEMKENVFVQGAELVDDKMIVSSGQYKKSYIGILEDGQVKSKVDLDDEYFAEGLTYFNNKIYLLTWRENKVLTYDLNGETIIKRDEVFVNEKEGWGLTNNGEHLIMSDGSDRLYFKDANTFETLSEIQVKYNGEAIDKLNELEYANNHVYANVWMSNQILKINPSTGEVVNVFDFSEYAEKEENILDEDGKVDIDAVLNGIAHIEDNKFMIFGKNYKYYYIVELD